MDSSLSNLIHYRLLVFSPLNHIPAGNFINTVHAIESLVMLDNVKYDVSMPETTQRQYALYRNFCTRRTPCTTAYMFLHHLRTGPYLKDIDVQGHIVKPPLPHLNIRATGDVRHDFCPHALDRVLEFGSLVLTAD